MAKYSLNDIMTQSWWDFNNLKTVCFYRTLNWKRLIIDFYKDQNRNIDSLIIDDEEFTEKDALNLMLEINNAFSNIAISVFNSTNVFWVNHYELKNITESNWKWNSNFIEDFLVSLLLSNACSSNDGKSFEEYVLNNFNDYKEIDFSKVKMFLLDSFKIEFWIKDLNKESSLIAYYFHFIEWILNTKSFVFKDSPEFFHNWKNRWSRIETIQTLKNEANQEILNNFEVSEDWRYKIDGKSLEEILDLSWAIHNLWLNK